MPAKHNAGLTFGLGKPVYKEMRQLIGRNAEDLDWQRQRLEKLFRDDSPDDSAYDAI